MDDLAKAKKFITIISYVSSLIIASIGVPLALKMIGPNASHGIRTDTSLSSVEAWYAINFFAGVGLIIAGIASIFAINTLKNNENLDEPLAILAIAIIPAPICLGSLALTIPISTFFYL